MKRLLLIWKVAKLILTAKRFPRVLVTEPTHDILVVGNNGWVYYPTESGEFEQTKITAIFAATLKAAAEGNTKAEEILQQGMTLLVEEGLAVRTVGHVSASIH